MQNEQEKRKEEAEVLDDERMRIIIPQCCREGWDSCPHVLKKQRITKKNVGL